MMFTNVVTLLLLWLLFPKASALFDNDIDFTCKGKTFRNVTLTAYFPDYIDADNEYGYRDKNGRKLRTLQVFLCATLSPASTSITAKPILKRQADSFVVGANYGVQSGNANNPSVSQYSDVGSLSSPGNFINPTGQPVRNLEPLPTPSAWVGGNFASNSYEASPNNRFQSHLVDSQYSPFTTTFEPRKGDIKNHSGTAQYMPRNSLSNFKTSANSGEIVYGTINPRTTTPTWYKTPSEEPQEKPEKLKREFVTGDVHKPTIGDLQEMISKIVKGGTRVHQVVKVPAVYEIHLQEEDNWGPERQGVTKNVQLPGRPRSQPILQPLNKPYYPRVVRHQTKTWNLPSKIKYFNKKPSPHAVVATSAPIYGNKHYGSVNVPMTPGSTAVTLWDHSPQSRLNAYGNFQRHTQVGAPDLSWYYAKKKELENEGLRPRRRFGKPDEFRRNDNGVQSKRRDGRRMIVPFSGVSYIVHVREKSVR